MCSFAVVILFIGSLINFANYTVENAEIDYSLNVILEKKHALELIMKKEKNVRDAYNKKLIRDELEREKNEKKILQKCNQ